jgi:hypothetical protein
LVGGPVDDIARHPNPIPSGHEPATLGQKALERQRDAPFSLKRMVSQETLNFFCFFKTWYHTENGVGLCIFDQNLIFCSDISNNKGVVVKATLLISLQATTAGVPIFRGK